MNNGDLFNMIMQIFGPYVGVATIIVGAILAIGLILSFIIILIRKKFKK